MSRPDIPVPSRPIPSAERVPSDADNKLSRPILSSSGSAMPSAFGCAAEPGSRLSPQRLPVARTCPVPPIPRHNPLAQRRLTWDKLSWSNLSQSSPVPRSRACSHSNQSRPIPVHVLLPLIASRVGRRQSAPYRGRFTSIDPVPILSGPNQSRLGHGVSLAGSDQPEGESLGQPSTEGRAPQAQTAVAILHSTRAWPRSDPMNRPRVETERRIFLGRGVGGRFASTSA